MGSKDERKFENLHKLVQILLDHTEGLTKAEIARKLGVHRSTAAEYIDSLGSINVPVYEIVPGRFTVDRDHYEVSISVDMHESLALHLAARLLTTRTDKHYPHAASALRKLGVALEKLAPLVSEHMKRSADVLDGAHRRRDSAFLEVLETLTRSWSQGRKVRLTHEMKNGQTFAYTFAPYFIEPYAVGHTLHVIGLREPPGKVRTLKIERIRTVRLLDETYSIPEDFDPSVLLKDAWGIWVADGESQTVTLRFSPQAAKRVQETQWHYSQQTEVQSDGSLLWTARVEEWKEMLPWIRGWGAMVEVIEPDSLRNTLMREARELARVYRLMDSKKELLAHIRKADREPQYLWDHLTNVSSLAGKFADKVGLKELGEVLGLLHDLGKASDEFQRYICSAEGVINPDADEYIDPAAKKGQIDHSTAGAQVLFERLAGRQTQGQVTAQALALCIASHHSRGLIDCLTTEGDNNFKRRIEKPDEKTHAVEALAKLEEVNHRLDELLSKSVEQQFVGMVSRLKEADQDSKDTLTFKWGLLIRFLYSCLLDADRLDTADFESPHNTWFRNFGQYRSWETLCQRLETRLHQFQSKPDRNEVDELRDQVSQACLAFSAKPKGIYRLAVPTGGGKTLASLRFALNHANHHQMDRIFYIIPYTSIIDQNAEAVREILEDRDETGRFLGRVVLEHHSNLTPEEETHRQHLLAENWDAPVVFTTQVQFLETLFGSGTRGARRMHQLANSVIVFDEVQTIPVRCVYMFNLALRFLVHCCGASVVLCTATQPVLDEVEPNHYALKIEPDQHIIQNEKELFSRLKRIEAHDIRRVGGWSNEEVAELAEQELQVKGSVLVVVNTRRSARSLYNVIATTSRAAVYHLSTNMCPTHRLKVLDEVRAKLNHSEPVICVSTQLIEAGVDIDFGSVIRYLAGLDSITQAAGRCNRNGKQQDERGCRTLGRVWIVNPAEERVETLKDIQTGTKIAERFLGEFQEDPTRFEHDRLGLDAVRTYYRYYFHDRKDEMSYPVNQESPAGRDDTLFNLLSLNTASVQAHIRSMGAEPEQFFRQSFQTAARVFHAIDSPTQGVVVPFGEEGKEIVKALCGAFNLEKQYRLLKQAQRYSVNLLPHEFARLASLRAIQEVQAGTGIFYLNIQYYNDQFGWSDEIQNPMETIVC